MKLRSAVVAGVLLSAVFASEALTLGRTRGAALIGRPLDLAISVRLEGADDTAQACFEADVFQGDTRIDASRVKVTYDAGAGQDGTVRVQSSALVDEPVVTVYLRVGCTQKTTRRYVLLADLPSESVTATAPSGASVPAMSIPATVQPAAGGSLTAPSPGSAAASTPRATSPRAAATAPAAAASSAAEAVAARAERRARRQAEKEAKAAAAAASPKAAPAAAPAAAAASAPARATSVALKRKPETAAAGGRARLKLDPLDLAAERDPTLRASLEMLTAPAESDQRRAEAAAMWRAINAQPQDILRDSQRMQALEADVKSLRDMTARNQATVGELKTQLQKAESERYANWLVYALALALIAAAAAAVWVWKRGRADSQAVQDWWRGRGPVMDDEEDRIVPVTSAGPLPQAPAVPAKPTVDVDVDLDVDESKFESLKAPKPVVIPPLKMREEALPRVEHSDFVASMPGISRAVNAEELFDIQQQADFFISLGQYDQAIEVLKNHISDNVETSALAYLDLLKIYHQLKRRDDYDHLREDFNKVFNAQVPVFDAFSDRSSGLEAYQSALSRIEALWPSPKVLEIIEESIFRKPGSGDGEAFDLEAYRELLLLYAMAKDVVDRGSSMMDFELSGSSPVVAESDSHPPSDFSSTNIQPLSASMGMPSLPMDSLPDPEPAPDMMAMPDLSQAPRDWAIPRASPRLGLDIDLSEDEVPSLPPSAFIEVNASDFEASFPSVKPQDDGPESLGGNDEPAIHGDDLQDSGKPGDSKPADDHMIDFDLFDDDTERDIAPKKPPRR